MLCESILIIDLKKSLEHSKAFIWQPVPLASWQLSGLIGNITDGLAGVTILADGPLSDSGLEGSTLVNSNPHLRFIEVPDALLRAATDEV